MEMLERDAEFNEISTVIGALGETGGKVVLVRGEAGIGKTTLVRALIDRHRDSVHLLTGRCDDLSTPRPLGPFWDMAMDEAGLGELMRDGDRRGLFAALFELLDRQLQATLMVVEDTQWSDAATLDAIKFIGRRIHETNGVLVLTYRDGGAGHSEALRPVIGDVAAEDLVRIRLHPLSEEAVHHLLEESDLDSSEVWAVTGGNPFYVTEMLRAEAGAVPVSVRDSVMARVAKLDDRARELVELVSVVPGSAESGLIEAVGVFDPASLAAAEKKGLLAMSGDRIGFRHELARRAVEATLAAADRIELNRRVLTALPDDAESARLVHHARESGDTEMIVRWAPVAAAHAAEMGSYREAAAHYELLEPHLDAFAPVDRADILTEWARAAYLLDENPLAADLTDAALELRRELADPVLLSEVLCLQSELAWARGNRHVAVAAIDEAVASLAETPHRRRYADAIRWQGQLAMNAFQVDVAIESSDHALQLAEELDDRRITANALINKGTVMSGNGLDFEEGMRLLDQGQALAAEEGMGHDETRAALNRLWCMVVSRRLEGADAAWQAAREVSFRHEIPAIERHSQAIGASYLEMRGDWGAAEEITRELLASDLPSHTTDNVALIVLGSIEARRGRAEARDTLTRAWELACTTEEAQRMAPAAAALVEHAYLSGDRDEALLSSLSEVLKQPYGQNRWFPGPIAYWLWRIGVTVPPLPLPEPLQASIDGDATAAAAMWAEIGSPYGRADALSLGDSAQQLEALRIFNELGAVAAARLVAKELHDHGVSIPRGRAVATRHHAAGLTARQAEVLLLLAEGLSNPEIADRLFLSPRTVEHHVAAVISKLDVSTRREAVAAASSQGLLTSP